MIVRDESMTPAFRPGDRLWVERRRTEDPAPRVGEVVVAQDPESATRLLVKRVALVGPGWVRPTGSDASSTGPAPAQAGTEWEVPADSVWLLSDRPDGSRDSRRFGPVGVPAVLGTVWFRYAPSDRRGPVEPGPAPGFNS